MQRPRVIVGVKNHGILAPGDALPPPASSVCLAGAELRQVAATSPLEAACRCGSATPGLGTVLHAFGRAATPQPHDIAGHAVPARGGCSPMQTPAPPISRPSTGNGVMTASRFQGLFLTARVRWWPMQMGPHRTVPRSCSTSGASVRPSARARQDTLSATRLDF